MLPRAEAPARRLPYTTADMSERLAKKKAEQDAATNAQLAGSVLGPGITRDAQGNIYANGQKVDWSKSVAPTAVPSFNKGTIRPPDPPKGFMDNVGGLLSTAATMGKSFIPGTKESYMLADTIQKNPLSVPLSVVNSFVNTGKNIADLGQVVGGPDLGEPGINYAQAYKRGEGLTMGVEDLLNVLAVGGIAKAGIAKVKPKGFVEGELVSPGVPRNLTSTPRQIIDVAEGSRLPARVVDSPATPATRLAEAQTARASTPLPVAPVVETVKLPWSRQLPNSKVVKYTEPHIDHRGNLLKNGRNITLKVLDKNTNTMTGAMNIDVDFATQTATLEMMGVVDEFTVPQLAAAALHELKQFDFLKSQYPLIPSPNIPRPLIEQLQQVGLIDPSYQIPAPGPQNAFDAVQGPNFVNEWQFNEELVPQNYQPYFDSIMESLSPTKVLEPNFVINSPDAAHYFVANGGALDKVPSEHLFQSIKNNGFKGGRFNLIGSAGGHIGMDRYVDLATGQHLGLKYAPGRRYLFKNPTRQPNGFYTAPLEGPLGEILSNEVAVALGFPNMNLRLIVNSDGTVSIITDLAQDVYGGKIIDSHGAGVPANGNLPQSLAPGNFVPVEDRIRMAVLDFLIDNGDRNVSNVLFSIDEAGGIRLVPIDHEITFFPARDSGIGYPAAMNFSVRNAYFADPIKLFEEIKTIITKIQDDLQTSQIVKKFESKLLETTKKVGIDFTDLNAADKWDFDSQIQSFENKVKAYLSADPEELAQKYIDQIKEWVNP
jgi:hypothetical protein